MIQWPQVLGIIRHWNAGSNKSIPIWYSEFNALTQWHVWWKAAEPFQLNHFQSPQWPKMGSSFEEFVCSNALKRILYTAPCNSFFIKLIFNVFLLQRQQKNGALIHRDWKLKSLVAYRKSKVFSLPIWHCTHVMSMVNDTWYW